MSCLKSMNEVRFRILGNQEILGKYINWVETEHSAKSLLQKQNFDSSGQKVFKQRYQIIVYNIIEYNSVSYIIIP